MKFYAGIGSRETPPDILALMTKVAQYLSSQDYTLRSGGADGADTAFERGAGDKKEIYLPWKGFNKSRSQLYNVPEQALLVASKIHPAWDKCTQAARKLHGRNILQVLGADLNTPVEFVLCWTKDGKEIGGTATAMRLAREKEIPVFNFAIKSDLEKLAPFALTA